MSVGFKVNAIYVGKANMGLTFVPQDTNINVTYLNIGDNRIICVTNMSFPLVNELNTLQIRRNGLTYIENGAFDYNAKLENIWAGINSIMQLPHSFGLAATSLRRIDFWSTLRDPAIGKMDFTEMIKLNWLNIGCSNHHGIFDASRLPQNLETIILWRARQTQFPDFARYTPNTATIMVPGNAITEVPGECIVESLALKQLYLANNKLSTVPLTKLQMAGNQLVCDQSLCWISMWSLVKTPSYITDAIRCETPGFLQGVLLTDINPVTLGCQNGACYWQ